MTGPRYPALYQINTRAWLYELGGTLGRPATLEDVSDASIEQIAAAGCDWVWLLGIWQTGAAGRQVSLSQPEWQAEYHELLPDFTADDVCGSPFATRDYAVNRDLRRPRPAWRSRTRVGERPPRPSAPGGPTAPSGSSWISCPTTPRAIPPGPASVRSATCAAARTTWRAS